MNSYRSQQRLFSNNAEKTAEKEKTGNQQENAPVPRVLKNVKPAIADKYMKLRMAVESCSDEAGRNLRNIRDNIIVSLTASGTEGEKAAAAVSAIEPVSRTGLINFLNDIDPYKMESADTIELIPALNLKG